MDSHHDDDVESQSLSGNGKSDDRKPSGDDPITDWLLKNYYWLSNENNRPVLVGIAASPLILMTFFYYLVSNSTSNIIAFSALMVSLVFIGISMWMLCWILDKD
jgi:hypothetical protein